MKLEEVLKGREAGRLVWDYIVGMSKGSISTGDGFKGRTERTSKLITSKSSS